jgi:hypothetical protein
MTVFILSFIVMIVFVLALSLSMLFGRPAIRGSCRATENIPGLAGEGACSGACGKKKVAGDDAQGHVCRRSER